MTKASTATLVLVLTLSFVLSPLANPGFNGFTPEQFPVVVEDWPVQPVGWAFSIWGLIYLGLLAHAVYGLVRARHDADWAPMRLPLALSLGVGTFWLAVAQIAPLAATAMIVFMTAFAIAALLRAPQNRWACGPVGLYAGWLTAATGVAIAVVLGGYGVLSAQVAALGALVGVAALALGVLALRPGSWAYALGVGWALMGIIVANAQPLNLPVAGLAGAGILALALCALICKERTA